jgi:McbB family protein
VDRTYFVRGYDIVEMDDFHLLIADASTSKISSGSVLKLLTLLKARTQTYLSESSLLSMAEAENVVGGEFVEFLRDQAGVILDVTTLKDPEAPFSRVHIYTDAKVDVSGWIEYPARDGVLNVGIGDLSSICEPNESDRESILFAIFLVDYDAAPIEKVYGFLDDAGQRSALTSYFIGDKYWVDGIFIKNVGLPSHFSHVEKWRSLKTNSEAKTDWVDLVDMFANQQRKYVNPYRPMGIEITCAGFYFLRAIIEFSGASGRPVHLNDMLKARRLDVRSGECTREIVTAWPFNRDSKGGHR